MVDQLSFRLVTSSDDLEANLHSEGNDYAITDVAKIQLQPSGEPVDESLKPSLPAAGLQELRFIEPVTAILTVTLTTLAVRLVHRWLRSKEAGVQIDARTSPPTLSRIAGTPNGFVVVIDGSGKATMHQAQYESPEDLIPQLESLLAGM